MTDGSDPRGLPKEKYIWLQLHPTGNVRDISGRVYSPGDANIERDVNGYYFPISVGHDTVGLVLESSAGSDTVLIGYSRRFARLEKCEEYKAALFVSNVRVLRNTFDSVTVTIATYGRVVE
jgi:hypothetical protein